MSRRKDTETTDEIRSMKKEIGPCPECGAEKILWVPMRNYYQCPQCKIAARVNITGATKQTREIVKIDGPGGY